MGNGRHDESRKQIQPKTVAISLRTVARPTDYKRGPAADKSDTSGRATTRSPYVSARGQGLTAFRRGEITGGLSPFSTILLTTEYLGGCERVFSLFLPILLGGCSLRPMSIALAALRRMVLCARVCFFVAPSSIALSLCLLWVLSQLKCAGALLPLFEGAIWKRGKM